MKYCIPTLLVVSSLAAGQGSLALSLITRIPLPNVKGRIDHFGVDVKGQRLFVPEWGKLFAGVQGRDKQPSEVRVHEAK